MRAGLATALVGGMLLVGGGCGMFSRSTPESSPTSGAAAPSTTDPASPTPTPPRPSLREAGATIADEEKLKSLVQGQTTKDDVRERFGMPQEVVFSPGIETFVYYRDRTSGWISRTTERVEMLTIRFDGRGILKDFEYRFAGK
jgi:outer membrane protein assembly factor BamE (lipoprotein component of BamABCDE complex)